MLLIRTLSSLVKKNRVFGRIDFLTQIRYCCCVYCRWLGILEATAFNPFIFVFLFLSLYSYSFSLSRFDILHCWVSEHTRCLFQLGVSEDNLVWNYNWLKSIVAKMRTNTYFRSQSLTTFFNCIYISIIDLSRLGIYHSRMKIEFCCSLITDHYDSVQHKFNVAMYVELKTELKIVWQSLFTRKLLEQYFRSIFIPNRKRRNFVFDTFSRGNNLT